MDASGVNAIHHRKIDKSKAIESPLRAHSADSICFLQTVGFFLALTEKDPSWLVREVTVRPDQREGNVKRARAVVCFAIALGVASTTKAAVFSAIGDFSTSSNPNGPWSYGMTPVLGGSFSPYPSVGGGGCGNPALQGWQEAAQPPYVLKNSSGGATGCSFISGVTVEVPPGVLDLHPGSGGQDSVVRWTAPFAGVGLIQGSFEGLDFVGPTTTDAHILVNGVSIADFNINTFLSPTLSSFSLLVPLIGGDRVDFAVGFGSDGSFLFDSTGLSATISVPVPEPGILGILTTGLIVIVGTLRRRRSGRSRP